MDDSSDSPGVEAPKTSKRGTFDWEAIERDYRAGILSTREIAKNHGISHVSISKRAKSDGWVRDLSGKIKERVKTALITLPVNNESAGGNQGNGTSGNQAEREAETVEAAAQTQIGVIVSHRRDVNRGRAIVGMLMSQLSDAAEHRESIRDIIEDETSGDRDTRRRMAMLRAVAIPAHAGTIRDLATAMKNLVALERQAFGIDVTPDPDAPPPGAEDKLPMMSDEALTKTLIKLGELTGNPVTPTIPDAADEAPAPPPEA